MRIPQRREKRNTAGLFANGKRKRREQDSNLRYPCGYSRFRGGRFRPLSHLSQENCTIPDAAPGTPRRLRTLPIVDYNGGMDLMERLFNLFPLIFVAVWIVSIVLAIRRARGKTPAAPKGRFGIPVPRPDEDAPIALAPTETVVERYGTIESSYLGIAPVPCSAFLIQAQSGRELAFVFNQSTSDSGPAQYRLGYAGCKRLEDILGPVEEYFSKHANLLGYRSPDGPSVSRGLTWVLRSLFRLHVAADLGIIEDTGRYPGLQPPGGRKTRRRTAAMVWRQGENLFLCLVFRSGSAPVSIQMFGRAGREALRVILRKVLHSG